MVKIKNGHGPTGSFTPAGPYQIMKAPLSLQGAFIIR